MFGQSDGAVRCVRGDRVERHTKGTRIPFGNQTGLCLRACVRARIRHKGATADILTSRPERIQGVVVTTTSNPSLFSMGQAPSGNAGRPGKDQNKVGVLDGTME